MIVLYIIHLVYADIKLAILFKKLVFLEIFPRKKVLLVSLLVL